MSKTKSVLNEAASVLEASGYVIQKENIQETAAITNTNIHVPENRPYINTGRLEPIRTYKDNQSMSDKYPQYYKKVGSMTEIDVYAVHQLFNIQDPSGAIQHASKKLLLSGVRTGHKTAYQDIQEARDTLTRWLELNQPKN